MLCTGGSAAQFMINRRPRIDRNGSKPPTIPLSISGWSPEHNKCREAAQYNCRRPAYGMVWQLVNQSLLTSHWLRTKCIKLDRNSESAEWMVDLTECHHRCLPFYSSLSCTLLWLIRHSQGKYYAGAQGIAGSLCNSPWRPNIATRASVETNQNSGDLETNQGVVGSGGQRGSRKNTRKSTPKRFIRKLNSNRQSRRRHQSIQCVKFKQ